ncbi:unnamed protein product [Trifolium pratense]|uniref:Uncharacterized protein n=1 Tax=Trifolium pratense TaxID=57577 RepID=A0ACB0LPY0_TRIPR|nr:unnamed protein product [Trifolium pratense]
MGNWLLGFSGFIGIATSLQAELHAIYNGLCLAMDRGFNNVIIESDSTIAIGLVEHDISPLHPYAPLIKKIRQFQNMDWTIAFHHTLREGNECADWLAKKGATSDVSLKIWHSCPPQLSNVLIADASGVARLRA